MINKCKEGEILKWGFNLLYSMQDRFEGIAIVLPVWFIPRTCKDMMSYRIGDGVFTIGLFYSKTYWWDVGFYGFKFTTWHIWTNQITTWGNEELTLFRLRNINHANR
jgi:hypothetical protein